MSSLTTIFIPGTGYRGNYSPAAQVCFPPAVIPLPHTFNFLRPWCHLAVVAPLAAVLLDVPHTDPASTVSTCTLSKVQLCCLDNAHSPDACCFPPLPPSPNPPLLHTMYFWKAFCELFVISSDKIILHNFCYFPHQIELTLLISSTSLLIVLQRNVSTIYSTKHKG